jgi:RNA ligase
LTGVRSIYSGEYASHEALVGFGLTYGVEVVRALPGSVENIEQFMAEAYAVEDEEGYIIRFENGHMLKIKGLWYCQIHRTKDNLTREKDVWRMILDDNLDDVKPFMDPDDRARVDAYVEAFESRIAERGAFLQLHVDVAKAVGNDKKAFASSLKDIHPMDRGLLFSIWDGHDPKDCVRELLKKNSYTGTKIENVRRMINGLRWDDYRDHNVILDA